MMAVYKGLCISIILVLVLFAFVFYFNSIAPKTADSEDAFGDGIEEPKTIINEKSLPVYWEIKKGVDFIGYVAPSIHVSKHSYISHVEELLEDVDILALEVDLKEAEEYMVKKLSSFSRLNYSLEDYLPKETVNKIKADLGILAWSLYKNKPPGLLASGITSTFMLKNGYSNLIDVEAQIAAEASGKIVVGLEEVESQVETLVNSSFDGYWIGAIKDFYSDENPILSIEETEALYSEGDIKKYRDLYESQSNTSFIEHSQKFRDQIIKNRSKEVLDQGKTLIMVGALHIPSLIEFLNGSYNITEKRSYILINN